MREENYDKLRRALDQLPQYDTPDQLWSKLDQGLNKAPELTSLGKALPAYSPPSGVWNRLNAQLDTYNKSRGRLRTIYRWTARAAAIVLIFSAGYFVATYDQGPKVNYVYGQEQRQDASFVADWSEDEASFDRLMEQLANIDEPELNALRLELEELTAAKQEVEEMLRAYGEDKNIIIQLAEIETERSRVYRRAYAEL
ncbi:MAG: hypothetical protein AAF828_03715 [Bacteroidota bacterium]